MVTWFRGFRVLGFRGCLGLKGLGFRGQGTLGSPLRDPFIGSLNCKGLLSGFL